MLFHLKSFLWLILFPIFRKYYGIKIAKTDAEKKQVFKFRYQIYRIELSHFFLDEKHAKENMLYDDYDFLENTVILYSGNLDNITGTVRFTVWKDTPDFLQKKYFVDNLMADKTLKSGEIRFFQIKSAFRKSFLALTFFSSLYKITYERIDMSPHVIFCDCQPCLIENYMKIGCFPYTEKLIHEEFGILQVPLAIFPYNLDYLKKHQCITYSLAKYYFHKKNKSTLRSDHTRDFKNILASISLEMTPEERIKFRYLISEDRNKRIYDFILSHLKKITVLSIKNNTIVIRKDIIDYDVFFVIEGKLAVYIDEIFITNLLPGSIFGEMALISEHHRRHTDVKSLTDSKIFLIPRNFLSRLERTDHKAAIEFLHILCETLSQKLSQSNKHLIKKIISSQE